MSEPRILLRGADRRLLVRCRDAVAAALDDTPETIADADRRDVLEELVADIAEELGAKAIDVPPAEPEKPRTVRVLGGREIAVRSR